MKKILISTIILLIILLLGQLTYFNFTSKNVENKTTNIISSSVNNNTEAEQMRQGPEEDIVVQNVVEPVNIAEFSQLYEGNTKLMDLEKKLYTFVHTNVKNIYNMTTGKNINQILQQYTLNEKAINNMNIYSQEDFNKISIECGKVAGIRGITYKSSSIDLNSLNKDENGYSTCNVTIKYTNQKQITIKVYLANSSELVPSIKFGKQN